MSTPEPEHIAFTVYPTAPTIEDTLDEVITNTAALEVGQREVGWGEPTTPWIPPPPTSKAVLVVGPDVVGPPRSMGDIWVKVAVPHLPRNPSPDEVIREADVMWDVVQVSNILVLGPHASHE